MDITHSKTMSNIKFGFYLWALFLLCCMTLSAFGIIKLLLISFKDNALAIVMLLIVVFFGLIVLKDFKFLIIKERQIKIYSIFHWLGKRYALDNYVGIIKSEEYGILGSYITAYLVDKSMETKIKISGLFYRNSDELIVAINLPEIKNYELGVAKYFRLLFTGRIKLRLKRGHKRRKGIDMNLIIGKDKYLPLYF